jgi:hypothetical protein
MLELRAGDGGHRPVDHDLAVGGREDVGVEVSAVGEVICWDV